SNEIANLSLHDALPIFHAALMILALKVATSMVAGWTVFGLAVHDRRDGGKAASDIPPRAVGQVPVSTAPATPIGTMAASRQIRLDRKSTRLNSSHVKIS